MKFLSDLGHSSHKFVKSEMDLWSVLLFVLVSFCSFLLGARYHALLIPNCPGAVTDLANSGYLAKILQHFSTENSK